MKHRFTFIDLFSGIGGFHLGLSAIGGKCVMASDIDEYANKTYKKNFNLQPHKDITKIESKSIPNFQVLCAGFPCQSFSNIGPGGGLKDHRGALIYEVFRILKDKHPNAFILENVKGLVSHNKGDVLKYILMRLRRLKYKVSYKVLEATDFGLPQIRKRLFIVGVKNDIRNEFRFPKPLTLKKKLCDIMKGKTEREYAFTIRIGGRRSGIDNRFNWDCYRVNGKPRFISVKECLELQGFPRKFYLEGNTDKQLKQVGNSVPTTIVREIGKQLLKSEAFN
jgi:DNA (cytosine-5)-methyltransferase 1